MRSPDFEEIYKDLPREQKKVVEEYRAMHPVKELDVDGVAWQYTSSGEGDRTLFLIHGLLVTADMWLNVVREFEGEFRVIAPTVPSEPLSLDELCGGLARILEAEDGGRVVVVGMSAGGAWAQWFLLRYPELVDVLVLSHTGVADTAAAVRGKKYGRIMSLVPYMLLRWFFSRRWVDNRDSEWFQYRKAYMSEVIRVRELDRNRLSRLMMANARYAGEQPIEPETMEWWKGETHILATLDDKDAYDKLDLLRAIYPDAEVKVMDRGGHHTVLLYPEDYNKALKEILDC